jgi:serine/threonine protein kinase
LTTTQKQVGESPEIFGPYEVYERLGVGGMATVHRAKERGIEGFERIVALKRLLPHLAEDASFVRSFVREAKLASMLQHANIVQLYELGRVGHVLFISMEYIEGRDIRKILRRARKIAGPPAVSVTLSLMIQLCEALDYAHRRTDVDGNPLGLVHRDVSPSNVLVTESGHVKVIDFGIAKAQSSHLKTQTGRVKGKIAYMAPESVRGMDLDARSDIFSAGVIAHELLTARPLFSTKNEYETLLRVQRAEIDPPSRFNPDCPPELDELVLSALERDPVDRWQTAGQLRDALEHLRVQLGVSATPREVASWMEWAFSLEEPPSTTLRTRHQDGLTFTGISETIPGNAFSPISRSISTTSPTGGPTTKLPSPADVVALPGVPMPAGKGGEDDDAADMAWGSLDEEAAASEPLALEEIPDVSAKAGLAAGARSITASGTASVAAAGAVAASAVAASASGTGFGAGLLAAQRRSNTGKLAAGAVLMALAVGVAAYVALRPGRESAPAPAATTAVLKFAIEPADAVIDVQGYGQHQGAPLRLEVDAPGTYHVAIEREGFKSYVSEIELEPGELRTVQVALQPGGSQQASLAVRSTPSGQRVMLDGTLLDRPTPLDLEVSPGAHVLAIVDAAGKELWRHELDASANTQYEFHPALQEPAAERVSRSAPENDGDDDDRERRRRRAREDEREPVAVVAAPPQPAAAAEPRAAIPAPGGSMFDSVAMAAPPTLSAPPPPPTAASPTLSAPPPSPTAASRPASAPSREAAAPSPDSREAAASRGASGGASGGVSDRPVMVSSDKVQRRSGSLPQLEAAKRGDLPERIKALLCIDTRGAVTSVKLYDDLRTATRRELEQALRGWRYAPYQESGKAMPACFGIVFRTVLH